MSSGVEQASSSVFASPSPQQQPQPLLATTTTTTTTTTATTKTKTPSSAAIPDELAKRVIAVPGAPGVYYAPDWITQEMEALLLRDVSNYPARAWTQLTRRRLLNLGGIPTAEGMLAESLPEWLHALVNGLNDFGAFDGKSANHVLINEYTPGQGILPHTDGPLYHPSIATISLGSHTLLDFYHPPSPPSPPAASASAAAAADAAADAAPSPDNLLSATATSFAKNENGTVEPVRESLSGCGSDLPGSGSAGMPQRQPRTSGVRMYEGERATSTTMESAATAAMAATTVPIAESMTTTRQTWPRSREPGEAEGGRRNETPASSGTDIDIDATAQPHQQPAFSVLLEPRSLVLVRGAAYTMLHGISEVSADLIQTQINSTVRSRTTATVGSRTTAAPPPQLSREAPQRVGTTIKRCCLPANSAQLGELRRTIMEAKEPLRLTRDTRVSLTIRHVPGAKKVNLGKLFGRRRG